MPGFISCPVLAHSYLPLHAFEERKRLWITTCQGVDRQKDFSGVIERGVESRSFRYHYIPKHGLRQICARLLNLHHICVAADGISQPLHIKTIFGAHKDLGLDHH